MAADPVDIFSGFGRGNATSITTVTSDSSHKRAARSNRRSVLPFRHVSSSSEEDGSHCDSPGHSRRFHQGLRLVDVAAKAKSIGSSGGDGAQRHLVKSRQSQGSGSGTDAQPPSGSTLSLPAMTKEEFDSLPPTIRRKVDGLETASRIDAHTAGREEETPYFSTLERLRFAQDTDPDDLGSAPSASADNLPGFHPNITPADAATTAGRSLQDKHRPVRLTVLSRLPSECLPPSAPRPPTSALVRLHSSPASTRNSGLDLAIIHNNTSSDDRQLSPLASRQSIILDATDEALIKRGKRQPHTPARLPYHHLHQAVSLDSLSDRMFSRATDGAWMDGRLKETEDSLYDTFRWLEDESDLDLRLDLDNQYAGLRQDVVNRESRSASFRRKLSISSKMTFGRASTNTSRPTTKEAFVPFAGSVLSLHNPAGNGHVRRRSRALSLMSAAKQSPTDAVTVVSPPPLLVMDPAAHYQDPEARMKLRVYLASPHKFDEAVEFGFPSTEQPTQSPTSTASSPKHIEFLPRSTERSAHPRMQTLVEDKRCSRYSDEATATESDSPRTPDTLDNPAPFDAASQASHEPTAKIDYTQAHAYCREMTLRMTLTRSDLRASEEHMYGWQQNNGPSASDGTRSPLGPMTDDELKKDSIERQLAAIDQENLLYPEQGGAMKRFWNRVRRAQ